MTKYMINEEYDVDEAEARKSFGKGEKRSDYADAWKETGNVILMGLPGCGKNGLADILSERTGLPVARPTDSADAVELLGGEGRVIVLEDAMVEDAEVQPLIHGAGKAFYLLADSNTLASRVAARDGIEDQEQLWRDMSARLAVMEPIFYGALHFIIQAVEDIDVVAEDALEKIAY